MKLIKFRTGTLKVNWTGHVSKRTSLARMNGLNGWLEGGRRCEEFGGGGVLECGWILPGVDLKEGGKRY